MCVRVQCTVCYGGVLCARVVYCVVGWCIVWYGAVYSVLGQCTVVLGQCTVW